MSIYYEVYAHMGQLLSKFTLYLFMNVYKSFEIQFEIWRIELAFLYKSINTSKYILNTNRGYPEQENGQNLSHFVSDKGFKGTTL